MSSKLSYFADIGNAIGILLLLECYSSSLHGSDWPIYKGNFYFTGNNDEIIVKNNNLKGEPSFSFFNCLY